MLPCLHTHTSRHPLQSWREREGEEEEEEDREDEREEEREEREGCVERRYLCERLCGVRGGTWRVRWDRIVCDCGYPALYTAPPHGRGDKRTESRGRKRHSHAPPERSSESDSHADNCLHSVYVREREREREIMRD